MFSTNDPYQKERRQSLRNNMTPAEKELWKYLRGKQILGIKFRRQFGVGAYILDFYCHERRLCIEIDGDSHFENKQKAYDEERTLFLKGLGINVIRYTNHEIHENIDGVLENLSHILDTTS